MALKTKGGHLLKKNGHLTTCCCTFCCHRDPWPTLYATFDQFEIDLPLIPNTFPECSFFCTAADLNALGMTAIPSTFNDDGFKVWDYGNGPGSAPRIDFADGTWVNLRLSIECVQFTNDGVWRYQVLTGYENPLDPSSGTGPTDPSVFSRHMGGDVGMMCAFNAFQYEVNDNDPDLHPNILAVAGASCDPFYLQALIECRVFRWVNNNAFLGKCYTTGRFRLTVTE